MLCKQSPIFVSLLLGIASARRADAANCLCREKIGSDTGGFVCVDSRKTQLRGGRQAGVPRGAATIAAGIANAKACCVWCQLICKFQPSVKPRH